MILIAASIIVAFLLIAILAFWIYGFFVQNDLSVRSENIHKYKKILAIFAHPDDEMLSCGGVMANQKNTTLLILTKGERGNPDAHLDLNLKKIRHEEAKKAEKIYGVSKLIHADIGDGQLDNKKAEITKRIKQVIQEESPDLIITHEPSGGYGHPDHMTCSQVVSFLVKKDFPKIHLWQTCSPKSVQKFINLPETMAKDKSFKNLHVYPNLKVFVGLKNFERIKALYTYKSQYQSYWNASLFHPIPIWFFISMSWYEHFYEVT